MSTVASGVAMPVPGVTPESVTLNCSGGSAMASLTICTVIVFAALSPPAQLSVPLFVM